MVVPVTVSAMVVLAVSVPEVPVIVTVELPAVAVLPAANVTTVLPVAGLVPNVAVTPLGRPDAANVTLPVKLPKSVTVTVSVALELCFTETDVAAGDSVKLGAAVTTSAIVVDAVVVPEVPEMITVELPVVAVPLAANVTMLVPVAGLVPNVAETPLGKPEAARVTLPVNPPTSVTARVSVALEPGATETEVAEGARVKPGTE